MGFCVPTNVIPNWMVVGVVVLVVVLVGGGLYFWIPHCES